MLPVHMINVKLVLLDGGKMLPLLLAHNALEVVLVLLPLLVMLV